MENGVRILIECLNNIVNILGLIINGLLLLLIFKKTSSKMKDYRPILFQNSVIDISYNLICLLMKVQIYQKNGHFYMFMIGPLSGVASPYNNFIICSWVFVLFFCLTSIPVQFIFRYFLIVKDKKLDWSRYFLLLFTAFALTLIFTISTSIIFWPNFISEENYALLKSNEVYSNNLPNFVVAHVEDWRFMALLVYAYFLSMISYGLTIFCSVKVWHHLDTLKNLMSAQTKEAQKQISIILAIQAILPGIFCVIPISLACTMTFLRINISRLDHIISFMFAVIPLVNSSMTLFVIKSYRKTILGIVKNLLKFKIESIEPALSLSIPEKKIQVQQIPRLT